MMWQTWTAFGIMLGYVMDIAFQNVPDSSGIRGLNWRLMLGSVSSVTDIRLRLEADSVHAHIGWCSCPPCSYPGVWLPRVSPVVHDEGPLPEGVRVSASSAPH